MQASSQRQSGTILICAIRQSAEIPFRSLLPSTQAPPLPDMGVAHVRNNTLNTTVRDAPRDPDERFGGARPERASSAES